MSECYKTVCKTWYDLKRKEQDRTEASTVRLMRPETGVTRHHQTMGMPGEEVQMDVGVAGSGKKYIMGTI
jgi:phage protein D